MTQIPKSKTHISLPQLHEYKWNMKLVLGKQILKFKTFVHNYMDKNKIYEPCYS